MITGGRGRLEGLYYEQIVNVLLSVRCDNPTICDVVR